MPQYSPSNSPEQNLAKLAENPYAGRFLSVGYVNMGEVAVLAYALQGRSVGSRNRSLVEQDNIVSTEIVDTTLPVGDPELTIYDAMRRIYDIEVVSNGNQTDRVAQYLRSGRTFAEAMEATDHEPDRPNFTPRITGYYDLPSVSNPPQFGLSVIGKRQDGEGSDRKLYTQDHPDIVEAAEGHESVGFAVHTYQGDGNPLPSFNESPFAIPVHRNAREMAGMLWDSLDADNRVAVAVKTISRVALRNDFAIINRHK